MKVSKYWKKIEIAHTSKAIIKERESHDQNSRTPTNKMLTLIQRVTQKHAFSIHQINTPFICHESFSPEFSYAKKYRAMIKKHMKLSK